MSNNKNEGHTVMANLISYKEILSFNEALIYLDISKSKLYKLTSNRLIEFYKPNGGKLYFKKVDLDNWMLQGPKQSLRILKDNVTNHLIDNRNGEKKN